MFSVLVKIFYLFQSQFWNIPAHPFVLLTFSASLSLSMVLQVVLINLILRKYETPGKNLNHFSTFDSHYFT